MLHQLDYGMWLLINVSDLTPPASQGYGPYGSTMRKSGTETRKQVLDAAETIVRRDGVARLTLDAVVKEAGISKGGILYHFSGKQALIQGMLERLFREVQAELDALLAKEPEGPGRWVRAYIRSAFQTTHPDQDLTSALVAALANDPELLAPLEQEFTRWEEQGLKDGLEPDLAMALMLAADGFWLGRLFNTRPMEPALREQVCRRLLKLAGGTD